MLPLGALIDGELEDGVSSTPIVSLSKAKVKYMEGAEIEGGVSSTSSLRVSKLDPRLVQLSLPFVNAVSIQYP